MKIIKLDYCEYKTDRRNWDLTQATFSQINLIVGRNSTGKSRLLTVIHSLSQLLKGNRNPFSSGDFKIQLEIENQTYLYEIECVQEEVIRENLFVDGEQKLKRAEDGAGEIWYEKEDRFLEFKLPRNAVAAVNRRDEIQHPYLIQLNKWANSISLYHFGSDFGRSQVMPQQDMEAMFSNQFAPKIEDQNNLVAAYSTGFLTYGEKFDKAIIKDMDQLGYKLKDVGAESLQSLLPAFPIPAIGLFTVEKDLGFKNPQIHMSQGMFRALALSINLNIRFFSKSPSVVLIDDIGEGLDFERAQAVIDLLINKALKHKAQLVMTSNDRFVMNKVPLEYWGVLTREKGHVRMHNIHNSKEQFDDFKYLGLNNFDFFASDLFEKRGQQ